MPDAHEMVHHFLNKLKKRKVEGSQATANQTAELLRSLILQHRMPRTNQAGSLIDAIRTAGERLIAANPVELAVGNIVRRILHIVMEEDISLQTTSLEELTLTKLSDDHGDGNKDDNPSTTIPHRSLSAGDFDGKPKSADKNLGGSRELKHNVIEAVNELVQDIATCHEQIAEQAVDHIHHNEVILTFGRSRTVLEFFLAAKEKKRSFRVLVAEGSPKFKGHLIAKELAEKGLQTTLIPDAAVFAMISRVNMVIVAAHAVLADGSVVAPVGLHIVALAAKKHAVPFLVLAEIHKLCPLYPHNPEVELNELRSPAELLDFGEFSDCLDFGSGAGSPLLHVINPAFDHVPPKLVSLFITDTGGHIPSYMCHLIADYYSTEDLAIQHRTA